METTPNTYQPKPGELVGEVTDTTPASLEYGNHRDYVAIHPETGEWLGNIEDPSWLHLGPAVYSEEYDDLRPVLP